MSDANESIATQPISSPENPVFEFLGSYRRTARWIEGWILRLGLILILASCVFWMFGGAGIFSLSSVFWVGLGGGVCFLLGVLWAYMWRRRVRVQFKQKFRVSADV